MFCVMLVFPYLRSMKLKFSIQYKTEWGQCMHVLIRYRTNDLREHVNDWVMQTQDGEWWFLETALMESRQRTLISFTYEYQLKDQEGKVLRCEWNRVPRTYQADDTKSFVFPDQWRDVPLHAYLYSKARNVGRTEPVERSGRHSSLPLFRKTVIFRVLAPQLTKGERVALVGSHPAIGSWNPTRYLRMVYQGDFEWRLSVNMDGMQLPLEYKYVVIDEKTNQLLNWEEGANRMTPHGEVNDGEVIVLDGGSLHLKEEPWKVTGVAVPVFALRSKHSYGVGDFGDLQRMVDWVAMTGMQMIELMPVNDTTGTASWNESHPYHIISCSALHPHYLDLEQLGELTDKVKMKSYLRQRRELNSLTSIDYPTIERVKNAYIDDIFADIGEETLSSDSYLVFHEANKSWLLPYAAFCQESSPYYNDIRKVCFVQYHLYRQLKKAVDYAHSKGVVLKGDLPFGVSRDSVEMRMNPQLAQPTYRWDEEHGIYEWWRQYLLWMEQFFDAVQINHIIDFFRSWIIVEDKVVTSKLSDILSNTNMLLCVEDEGMQPAAVYKVLDDLRIPRQEDSPITINIKRLHDWLVMDRSLPEQVTIEELMKAKRLNTKIKTLINRSKR